jgi:hypothetical protein
MSDTDFLTRCRRLGFHAMRLSAIGSSSWGAIFDRFRDYGMADQELASALGWCEHHPGRTWKPPASPATHDSIRQTCKLVEAMRVNPEAFHDAARLVQLGEELISRHIETGRAPPDVVSWYSNLGER